MTVNSADDGLDAHESDEQNQGRPADQRGRKRHPRPGHAALEQGNDAQGAAAREQRGAGEIDAVVAPDDALVKVLDEHPGRQHSHR